MGFRNEVLILILVCSLLDTIVSAETSSFRAEIEALKAFKSLISLDSVAVLADWIDETHHCNWTGITCDPLSTRVISIYLPEKQLKGEISPSLGNISSLQVLDLSSNLFTGLIPMELGYLENLQFLELGENFLNGSIPRSICNCTSLSALGLSLNYLTGTIPSCIGNLVNLQSFLDLSQNRLSGVIPLELGVLRSLQSLTLHSNNLSGGIPSSLMNLTNLTDFSLRSNSLEGEIPKNLGSLYNLENLVLSNNLLEGSVPSSITNCTHLANITLSYNRLTGKIPDGLGNLKNLASFIIGVNQMFGAIPEDLYNCSNLRSLDLSRNSFSGSLERSIGRVFRLRTLQFHSNSFSGIIPGEIGNISQLISLELARNRFSGRIPSEISRLSLLQGLTLAENVLEGSIPEEISEAKQLVELQLQLNRLTGPIPDDLSKLEWISYLDLHGNDLSGSISINMSYLNRLIKVDLSHNHLTGSIPGAVLASMKNMQIYLNLSNNALSGSIPEELGGLLMVQAIDISNNNLSGRIPWTLRGCKNLLLLDLSGNTLSSHIPGDIFSELDLLTSLNLSGNSLVGELPVDLAKLHDLSSLDLSRNNLSGRIPNSFINFTSLKYLNLSFNQLEGPVPTVGIFKTLTLSSWSGNPALCGNHLLRSCDKSTAPFRFFKKAALVLVVLGSIFAFTLLVSAILIFCRCSKKQKPETTQNSDPQSYLRRSRSLKKCVQKDLEIATNSFDEGNVIGRSELSTVYKGIIVGVEVVAVKNFNLLKFSAEAYGCFAELNYLNRLKHRNLVKMIGYAWSGNIKAVVLEYMVNGSLESIIHDPGTNRSRWTFSQRLNVCVSVANALVYLHSGDQNLSLHGDLKPSNVLFDGDWEAHVSYIKTARILGIYPEIANRGSSSQVLFGRVLAPGNSFQSERMAPEYGYTLEFTTKGDVFSFGTLVMEFLTTRRPTEAIEDNGDRVTLRQFVEAALRNGFNRLLQVVDPVLALSVSQQEEEERMIDLLELALSCTHLDPRNRPNMNEVLSSLLTLRGF